MDLTNMSKHSHAVFPRPVRWLVRLELQAAAIVLGVYLTVGPAQSAVAWLELRVSAHHPADDTELGRDV